MSLLFVTTAFSLIRCYCSLLLLVATVRHQSSSSAAMEETQVFLKDTKALSCTERTEVNIRWACDGKISHHNNSDKLFSTTDQQNTLHVQF